MSKGAIFIGDNFIWRPEFDGLTAIGTGWTGLDYLVEDQLQPKAECPAQAGLVGLEVGVSGDTTPAPNTVILLGLEIGDDGSALDELVVGIQHWDGASWVAADVNQLQVPAPGGGRHVIISGMQKGSGGWRIQWRGRNLVHRLGGLYLGRLIQDLGLADENFSMRFVDRSKSTESEGGQIYKSSPQVSRQLRVQQGTVESIWALGVPAHGALIDVGAPSLLDGATYDPVSKFASIAESTAGDAIWGGLLEESKIYRMDYEQTQNAHTPPTTPRWELNTAFSSITLLNSTALHAGVGTAIFTVTAPSPPIYMVGGSGLGVAKFRINALSEISDVNHIWSEGFSTNLQSLIMLHGSSRPIFAMLFPTDGARNDATAIYGYMQLPIDMTARSGQMYSTNLTITEQN